MTSLTAPMRTMNKRPSTQRKKPSRLSLSELNGLHDGLLSLTGKWRLYFGKRCDSGVLNHTANKCQHIDRLMSSPFRAVRPVMGRDPFAIVAINSPHRDRRTHHILGYIAGQTLILRGDLSLLHAAHQTVRVLPETQIHQWLNRLTRQHPSEHAHQMPLPFMPQQ